MSSVTKPSANRRRRSPAGISTALRSRLRFMEAVLMWEGEVYRQRVASAFGVTENHLSKDIDFYRATHPNNLDYDNKRKRYLPRAGFKPHYSTGAPEEYLGLLRTHCDARDPTMPELPGPSSAATVPLHSGGVDSKTLQAVTRAVAAGTGLEVSYQSMDRPEPAITEIWPHDLVFSGTRWHARAFQAKSDGTRRFGDFVLARLVVRSTGLPPRTEAAVQHDAEWNSLVDVAVQPAPHLSASQQEAIAKEYGMSGSAGRRRWVCRLRRCLMPYFLVLHRLDARKSDAKKHRRYIELVDPTVLETYGFPAE
ncbi:MAG: hypothetical protein H0W24_11850 [Lysobacter sp.]|nr:hypothetical protein [Lysobacter sp.]